MRKIILDLTMSLDGYIEGPNQEIDWILADPETFQYLNLFAREIDTVLYGRTSYEQYGNYVPPEASSEEEKQFYASVGQMSKYVFSRKWKSAPENASLISGDIKSQVLAIKNLPGRHIWLFGGSDLITTFINLNLIDEYRISIQPVVLGAGNSLFKNITKRLHLTLTDVKKHQSGVVSLYYEAGVNSY